MLANVQKKISILRYSGIMYENECSKLNICHFKVYLMAHGFFFLKLVL